MAKSEEVVQVQEAEVCLREMLRQAGVDNNAPDAGKVWRVFQDFCRLPLSDPTTIVSFRLDRDDRCPEEGRRLCFERQMSVYDGEDYSLSEHLSCVLFYSISPDTRPLRCKEVEVEITSDNADAVMADFAALVEKSEPFKVLTNLHHPVKLLVSQHEI